MAERHSRQNRFSGTAGRRWPSIKGGAKQDLRTIAAGGCWCGEQYGHDWPGKSEGAPHPRLSDKQGDEVTVTEEAPHITNRDMKQFTRLGQRMLAEIVNTHGCRWRPINGTTIMLYPPDPDATPFKVSSKRPDQRTRQILGVQFMETFGLVPKGTYSDLSGSTRIESDEPEPESEPERDDGAPQPESEPEPEQSDDAPQPEVDLPGVVAEAVQMIQAALGVEDEALQALMQVDSLREQVRELTKANSDLVTERNTLRNTLAAERRDNERFAADCARKDQLLNEAVAERDKAKGRLAALRDALSGD